MTRKDLACLLMLIDHIGAVLFPDLELLRAVGRLAFPLFAYQVALGIRYTTDSGRYFLRLLLFALVAQAPFMLLFHTTRLNILFSFSLVVLLFHLYRRSWLGFALVLCAVPLLDQFYGLEYGLYGVFSVLLFCLWSFRDRLGILDEKKLFWFVLVEFFALNLIFIVSGQGGTDQLFSVFAVPLVLLDVGLKGFNLRLNRYFYYLFYPVHLTVLRGVAYVFAL